MLRWQKFFLFNFFHDKEFLKIFFFNSAIKKIEDKDLSWQEFIDDKIFFETKNNYGKNIYTKNNYEKKIYDSNLYYKFL